MSDLKHAVKGKLMHLAAAGKMKPAARAKFMEEADDDLVKIATNLTHEALNAGAKLRDPESAKNLVASDTIGDARSALKSAQMKGGGFFDDLGDMFNAAVKTVTQDVIPQVISGALLGKGLSRQSGKGFFGGLLDSIF